MEGVLRGLRRGIGACGGCIDIRGIQAGQGLVRPFMVVYPDKVVEARLLLQGVEGGGPGGFFLEGQVHTFMAAVLLGLSGLDAFDADAKAQPPDRQGTEAEQGVGGGEGDAVISADVPYGNLIVPVSRL